ncbi:MAG TPA: YihY/virulence factor BrkB family protein [Trueperaceae bacterium]
MGVNVSEYWQVLKQTVKEFGEDQAPRLAAALAYYTIFSIAPLLVIVLAIVGFVYGSEEARSQLMSQLQARIGPDAANLIGTMVERTSQQGGGILATVIGIVTLLIGATTVFAQLQGALNKIWDVAADRSRGIRKLLLVRLEGLGMVLALGFVLLVSFALQAALNVILSSFSGLLPGGNVVWFIVNQLLMLAVFTVVFGAIFMVLPDVELHWRNVLRGAIITAVLFKIGEFLIGFYLGFSGVKSTYGAAGSLVVLLLWIYYSSQILLFGAEFTQVDTRRRQKEEPTPTEVAAGS